MYVNNNHNHNNNNNNDNNNDNNNNNYNHNNNEHQEEQSSLIMTGNLVFLSARPHLYRGFISFFKRIFQNFISFHENLTHFLDSSESHSYVVFQEFRKLKGGLHTTPILLSGDMSGIFSAWGNYEPMARKKFSNFVRMLFFFLDPT